MTVRVRCPNCDGTLNLRREQLGKRGKCPKCGVPVVITEDNLAPLVSREPVESEPEPNATVEVLSKTWTGLTKAFDATKNATGNLIRARPSDERPSTYRPPKYAPPSQPPVYRPVPQFDTSIDEVDDGSGLKDCPFCGETIKRVAKKCKHCGEILDVVLRASQQQSQPQINITNTNANMGYQGARWSPLLAAFLSFLIPGLGQLYKGQPINGFVWFVVVVIGYIFLIIPGLILHLCCILGAATGDPYRR